MRISESHQTLMLDALRSGLSAGQWAHQTVLCALVFMYSCFKTCCDRKVITVVHYFLSSSIKNALSLFKQYMSKIILPWWCSGSVGQAYHNFLIGPRPLRAHTARCQQDVFKIQWIGCSHTHSHAHTAYMILKDMLIKSWSTSHLCFSVGHITLERLLVISY